MPSQPEVEFHNTLLNDVSIFLYFQTAGLGSEFERLRASRFNNNDSSFTAICTDDLATLTIICNESKGLPDSSVEEVVITRSILPKVKNEYSNVCSSPDIIERVNEAI